MTIIAVAEVQHLRYRGFDEPQFPTGIWRAQKTVTGDGSGGQASIQLDFSKASQAFNSQLYSLEQLMMSHSVAGQNAEMRLANFDQSEVVPVYTVVILANEGTIPAAISAEQVEAYRALWLGQANVADTAQSLTFSIDNGNGEVTSVLAYGYVWSARSINAPGGPQRPPQGLFSQ